VNIRASGFIQTILAFTGLVFPLQTNTPPPSPAFELLWQFDTGG
jgi:hypothetical protein